MNDLSSQTFLRQISAGESQLYVVGGVLRDMFLALHKGEPFVSHDADIDLLVEDDLESLITGIEKSYSFSITRHKKFLTATVRVDAGSTFDFVQARKELYSHSGALPQVTPGSLLDDVMRRDFSINTLRMPLSDYLKGISHSSDFKRCAYDDIGGIADLERKCIRVLHEKSFVDDPTRMFRALRYMGRIGGVLAEGTESLLQEALAKNVLANISPYRRLQEFLKLVMQTAKGVSYLPVYNMPVPHLDCTTVKELAELRSTATDFLTLDEAFYFLSEALSKETFSKMLDDLQVSKKKRAALNVL